MEKNQITATKSIVTLVVSLLFIAWVFFPKCGVLPSTKLKGTYRWDYNGMSQTIVISSNDDNGPCIWTGESGSTSNESYILYESMYDRPQLYIRGMVYIDVENGMVYSSDDDFRAYRNGRPCRITR